MPRICNFARALPVLGPAHRQNRFSTTSGAFRLRSFFLEARHEAIHLERARKSRNVNHEMLLPYTLNVPQTKEMNLFIS